MSNKNSESISAFLDSYEAEGLSVDDLKQDQQQLDTWGRYHMIGDVMRGEAGSFIMPDLANNIAVAIAAEPTVLAPQKTPSLANKVKAKVVQFAKPAGQFAIAASAAGLMVLGVQQANVVDDVPLVPTQVFQPMPFGGVADPVSYNYEQPSITQQKQDLIKRQQKLQAILLDHQKQIKLQANTNQPKSDQEQPEK
ncbi:sigma-E factor negative regulatory protein [Thalassotalea litorea]|uniref:sigma-E factor negative regulatory protein n=1 Tax=Thalassotalea litorea TaxID=2020715 RepID=UPI003735D78C